MNNVIWKSYKNKIHLNNNYIVVRLSLYESKIFYEKVESPLERPICNNFVKINFVKKKKRKKFVEPPVNRLDI